MKKKRPVKLVIPIPEGRPAPLMRIYTTDPGSIDHAEQARMYLEGRRFARFFHKHAPMNFLYGITSYIREIS